MLQRQTQIAPEQPKPPLILLIDDEDCFRQSLARQLKVRNFLVLDTSSGEDAIKIVRHANPDVVILDQKMPGMDGIQTLQEIKKVRPEVQVIMHTGHGSIDSARVTGKHDAFDYIEKPCAVDDMIGIIQRGLEERKNAMARHEIPDVKRGGTRNWFMGVHNARPGIILIGGLIFLAIAFIPTPRGLMDLLALEKTGKPGESIAGYAEYHRMQPGQTISGYYVQKVKLYRHISLADGRVANAPLTTSQAALRTKVMMAILFLAALFWATGAIPIGVTALLVGVLMYFFNIFPADQVAKAYAKDSVVFIFGVLALAAAISKTGLDRRIGMLLLGTSTSLTRFCLFFAPLLACTASFLSEHALVAFIAPILMLVYMGAIRAAGLKRDKGLVVMMMLMLTFSANIGGPGSPAAGGRNAVMLGIFADYGVDITFSQWMKMGLPFVPVMALVIAAYFLVISRGKIQVPSVNIAAEVRRESEKIGKMTSAEYKAALVLVLVIVLWVTLSSRFGMGGPVLLCLVLLNVMGVLRWRDINSIHWDVVALYAAASAMGYGLAVTGAALWLASSLVNMLPDMLKHGIGLCMSTSFITGILTNFMSDGATVAAVGPITVPMATLSATSPLMVGLATAFASSFAHMLVIGTPNNAIVFSMARDPDTGEQLLTMKDFFIHGFAVFVLSLLVLWGWAFWGYWQWIAM